MNATIKRQIEKAIEMSNDPNFANDPVSAATDYAKKCGKEVEQGLAEYFATGNYPK